MQLIKIYLVCKAGEELKFKTKYRQSLKNYSKTVSMQPTTALATSSNTLNVVSIQIPKKQLVFWIRSKSPSKLKKISQKIYFRISQ